ncbi:MAG: hypothetical protein V1667_00180 [bacterium]
MNIVKYAKDAIWVGRFQPPSIAHFYSLTAILKQWPHVTIGVVSDEIDVVDRKGMLWGQYLAFMRQTSCNIGKSLFSSSEIVALWEEVITKNDLCDRVNARPIMRPECSVAFDADFHFSQYDYVEIEGGAGNIDVENFRKQYASEMYRRAIHWVYPSLVLHNSQIKKLIARQCGSWPDYLAPGATKLFSQFNGPSRIAEATQKH